MCWRPLRLSRTLLPTNLYGSTNVFGLEAVAALQDKRRALRTETCRLGNVSPAMSPLRLYVTGFVGSVDPRRTRAPKGRQHGRGRNAVAPLPRNEGPQRWGGLPTIASGR